MGLHQPPLSTSGLGTTGSGMGMLCSHCSVSYTVKNSQGTVGMAEYHDLPWGFMKKTQRRLRPSGLDWHLPTGTPSVPCSATLRFAAELLRCPVICSV